MNAEKEVNDLIALTAMCSILYRCEEDMYDFAEIDYEHHFGICRDDEDISDMYYDEQLEVFKRWHNEARDRMFRLKAHIIEELEKGGY